jgi:hypothetical protein
MAFVGELTDADVAYVRENYVPLAELAADRGSSLEAVHALIDGELLPKPAYVLPDGTEMVAGDYFSLADQAGGPERSRAEFDHRFRAAARSEGVVADSDVLEAEWRDYLSGLYAVCLKEVEPEKMVRKIALVARITALLAAPDEDDAPWRASLREGVDALDELERPFSPDRDRRDPPTRVRLIEEPRRRFPEVFA